MRKKDIMIEVQDRRNNETKIEKCKGDVLLSIIADKCDDGSGYDVTGFLVGDAPRALVLDMAARMAFSAIENSSDNTVEILLNIEKFIKRLSKYIDQKLKEENEASDEQCSECLFAEECDH